MQNVIICIRASWTVRGKVFWETLGSPLWGFPSLPPSPSLSIWSLRWKLICFKRISLKLRTYLYQVGAKDDFLSVFFMLQVWMEQTADNHIFKFLKNKLSRFVLNSYIPSESWETFKMQTDYMPYIWGKFEAVLINLTSSGIRQTLKHSSTCATRLSRFGH